MHYTFEVRQPGLRFGREETFHAGALAGSLEDAERLVRDRYPRAVRVILVAVNAA